MGSLSRDVSVCGEVSVQRGLWPGGLCPEGSVSRGVSVQRGLCQVRILLECILVSIFRSKQGAEIMIFGLFLPSRCFFESAVCSP